MKNCINTSISESLKVYANRRNRRNLPLMNRPKNKVERAFYDAASSKGWIVSKKGWPDFFCIHPDGKVMVAETKSNKPRLAPWQNIVMKVLANHGIECFVVSERGVVPYNKRG